jgi:hypothetical protein
VLFLNIFPIQYLNNIANLPIKYFSPNYNLVYIRPFLMPQSILLSMIRNHYLCTVSVELQHE